MSTYDFDFFQTQRPPSKRAAYSDRTAYLMSLLAEMAYEPIDQEKGCEIKKLAKLLAEISDVPDITARLTNLSAVLEHNANKDNAALKEALHAGNFTLEGVLYSFGTDTQGFVVKRDRTADKPGMIVVVYRGTQQVKDWITNLKASKQDISSKTAAGQTIVIGQMHQGFYDAYKSIENQLDNILKALPEDYPVYLTGHSLGGALATVTTWFIDGHRLAACYTFGAPRVGTEKLGAHYRTPVYRVVYGPDPVPNLPPSKLFMDMVKSIVPFLPYGKVLSKFLESFDGYVHFGDQRYIEICSHTNSYKSLMIYNNVFVIGRLMRYWSGVLKGQIKIHQTIWAKLTKLWTGHYQGESTRIDQFHNIAKYRIRLKIWAERRQSHKPLSITIPQNKGPNSH